MELVMVSESLMTTEFTRALSAKCEELFPEVDFINHVAVDSDECINAEKILIFGKTPKIGDIFAKVPERWTPAPHQKAYYAPSMKEVMGTAGGLTKLAYAINLYLAGVHFDEDFSAPFTRISADTPLDSIDLPSDVEICVVDIEVSGDISKDEPDDCDLLAVSALIPDDTQDQGYRIFVWDASALTVEDWIVQLRDLLRVARVRIPHNGKFDFRWINRILGLNIFPEEDTMLMHHSMFHGAAEHGLKKLAQRILGAPEWEAGIEQWVPKLKDGSAQHSHYERIPQDVLCKYNAQDVFWTYQLFLRFSVMLEANPDAMRVYRELEMPAAHMFQEVEGIGMLIDTSYVKETLVPFFEDRLAHALPYLLDLAGTDNVKFPNSPVQVKKWFREQGILLASTDKDTMTRLKMNGIAEDFVDALINVRQLTKAYGTYVKGPMSKLRWDDRVHPVFKIHGTTTGRLSCSNPNVQNVPNDDEREDGFPSLRRMYVAAPGRSILGADFAQVELRVVAALCGDVNMLYDLRPGAPDFFDNMLNVIWPDIEFTGWTKAKKKPYRLREKRIVHGTNYGRSAWAIAAALTLEGTPTSDVMVEAIQDAYFGNYPDLQVWRSATMSNVLADKWVTPFGRAYQQDVITHAGQRRAQNMAWAFMPQSIASDICLSAAIEIHSYLKANGFETKIICTVHDAIYLEGPDEEMPAVQAIVTRIMERNGTDVYPSMGFPVDVHVGKSWDLA